MNTFNFQPFTGAGSKMDDRITITKIGSFGILSGFVKTRLHGNLPQYVELFYDEGNKAIAVHFSEEKQRSRSFSLVRTGGGGSVTARSFFKTYGLDPELLSGKYDVEEVTKPELGTLYVIRIQ